MRKKLSEFSVLCSVTKDSQQIAEHSAPVIPQSIRGRIPHSVFRIPQSILTRWRDGALGATPDQLHNGPIVPAAAGPASRLCATLN